MAKKPLQQKKSEDQNLAKAFWAGFFWPARIVWRGITYVGKAIAWLSHKPPLRQIGHALRWFFHLKPVRFVGKMLGAKYFYASWQELRQVTWPTRRDSFRLMGAVIIFSIAFGAFIAIIDYGLDKVFKQILLN